MVCRHCEKECKNSNSLRNHERLCPKNSERVLTTFGTKQYKGGGWNRGKTKHTDARIAAHSKDLKSKFASGKLKPPIHSTEAKEKLSRLAKERGLGGYRPHPNRGKWYNGIWFDSNWEVSVAIELDKNNIGWERPRIGFVWNDKGNKYYPDFYLTEYNVYLDPKNPYLQVKDEIKLKEASARNGIKIYVLNESQLSWKEISALVV